MCATYASGIDLVHELISFLSSVGCSPGVSYSLNAERIVIDVIGCWIDMMACDHPIHEELCALSSCQRCGLRSIKGVPIEGKVTRQKSTWPAESSYNVLKMGGSQGGSQEPTRRMAVYVPLKWYQGDRQNRPDPPPNFGPDSHKHCWCYKTLPSPNSQSYRR